MNNILNKHIPELESMKTYPKELFYNGNLNLLNSKKVSIVGARKTSKYARALTYELASKLGSGGVCVVSGGAIGVDAIAHKSAGAQNTIAVLPCGIDLKYPKINQTLLSDIQNQGLLLSQFEVGFRATPWSFVLRNEIVVALGDVLVVAEAELGSGSMRSIEFAKKMGKEIFVFPHRLGESSATNTLLKNGEAKAIYDIDEFVSRFCDAKVASFNSDSFEGFCKTNPSYDEVLKKYPTRVFEAELSGEIEVVNARVILKT